MIRARSLHAWVDGLLRVYRRRILRVTRAIARQCGDILAHAPMQAEHTVVTYLAVTARVP
jgi:hypothetical protein